MNVISFGLIGCGRIGERHAEQMNLQGRIAAVCDIDGQKAKTLANKYDIPFYTSHEELLRKENEIDCMAVCTPNGLHAIHCIDSSRAGFHVICEKPMALTVSDCEQMIAAAEQAGKKLFVVKQNRFNPPVMAVKELLDKSILGHIYSVQVNCFWNRRKEYYENSWKGTRQLDGGTLFTQFSHFIDLLFWLVGDIDIAFALTANIGHESIIEIEDTGCVGFKFKNGALGTLHYTVNSFNKNMEGSITIFGEKGTVKVGGQYLNELEYQQIENHKIEDLQPGKPANQYGFYQGSMSNHDKVYQEVIRVLTQGGTTTNGYDGMKTVEIISRIYAAAR